MSNAAQQTAPSSLQGKTYLLTTDQERAEALEFAFDYRGDLTLRFDGGETIEGYLFNRDNGVVQMYVKGAAEPVVRPIPTLVEVIFSGKDPADGKSYENWKAKKEGERRAEALQVEDDLRAKGYL